MVGFLKDYDIDLQVKLVDDPSSFNVQGLDSTDRIAVYGERNEVVDYIKNNLGAKLTADNLEGKAEDDKWEGDENPERTPHKIIAMNSEAIEGADLVQAAKWGGFVILHGLGHAAGSGHGMHAHGSYDFFMSDGRELPRIMIDNNLTLYDLANPSSPYYNPGSKKLINGMEGLLEKFKEAHPGKSFDNYLHNISNPYKIPFKPEEPLFYPEKPKEKKFTKVYEETILQLIEEEKCKLQKYIDEVETDCID